MTRLRRRRRPRTAHRRAERGFSLLELLIVVGLLLLLAAIGMPMMANTTADFRLTGDARSLHSAVSLAKMRAASAFSQSRLYLDIDTGTYHVDTLAAGAWSTAGGTGELSSGVNPGYGSIDAAPPNTQNAIGQAPLCRANDGTTIGNTACIVFNSRGIPVDNTGTPTTAGAFYITDGSRVFSVTVEANGMVQLWSANAGKASWTKQ
jgi:prepilin-type N-terminal cleavage/methylation domain-containing protein